MSVSVFPSYCFLRFKADQKNTVKWTLFSSPAVHLRAEKMREAESQTEKAAQSLHDGWSTGSSTGQPWDDDNGHSHARRNCHTLIRVQRDREREREETPAHYAKMWAGRQETVPVSVRSCSVSPPVCCWPPACFPHSPWAYLPDCSAFM